jgi:uncharacterized protein
MSELIETALRLLPPFNESAGASCPTKVPQWRNTRRCCRPIPRHGRSLAFAVDTNVLVYAPMRTRNCIPPAVTGSNSNGRDRCLYEFLRATTHSCVMRLPWSAPVVWNFVAALLDSPGLAVLLPTERHADVAEESFWSCRTLPTICSTTHTAVLMREHGTARICTRDTDFNQFPFSRINRSRSFVALLAGACVLDGMFLVAAQSIGRPQHSGTYKH